jgi:L-ascorbate metabolism protein UlaG (beta-lactamase superfamily)
MKTVTTAMVLAGLLLLGSTTPGPGADTIPTEKGRISIYPIQHATLALKWDAKLILVDPVGGPKAFEQLGKPDLILLTDIHGDHLSKETLAAVASPGTRLAAPPAVLEQLPADLRARTTAMTNGAAQEVSGIRIEAIPAYNLTPERQKFHSKGRGNGYVLNLAEKRIYISGDTEAVPEILALKNIDVAFVCMNLPYTMDVEQAALAVKAFKPKIVYPYHSRGSDLDKFKQLVSAEPRIEVRLRDWYAVQK